MENLLSQQILNQIGRQLGYSNGVPSQFVELANTLLVSGMRKNVRSPQGASSLFNALRNDHSNNSAGLLGNILGSLPNILGQSSTTGILDNIFGQQLDPIITKFAQATGMPKEKAKQLLMLMAPIVLAYFANKMTSKNMSDRDLAREVEVDYDNADTDLRTKQDAGLLEKLLDRDRDGNMMDEVGGLLKTLILR